MKTRRIAGMKLLPHGGSVNQSVDAINTIERQKKCMDIMAANCDTASLINADGSILATFTKSGGWIWTTVKAVVSVASVAAFEQSISTAETDLAALPMTNSIMREAIDTPEKQIAMCNRAIDTLVEAVPVEHPDVVQSLADLTLRLLTAIKENYEGLEADLTYSLLSRSWVRMDEMNYRCYEGGRALKTVLMAAETARKLAEQPLRRAA